MLKHQSEKSWTDESLDRARMKGDSVADRALADLLEPWPERTGQDGRDSDSGVIRRNLDLIEELMDQISPILVNADLNGQVSQGLGHFLSATRDLPEWADLEKIRRAEKLFEDSGVLSCVLFFCSSLPEVYVVPDISTVLHATGNLERITAQRIRATAIMILTVLLPGGLHSEKGGGRPQVLKARFIHSVIRNLILRNNPADHVEQSQANDSVPLVDAWLTTHPPRSMLEMTLAHGWDPSTSGVPINQEEMSYTLLTFSYVYLRSLRRLGLRFSTEDEEAYLHFWNVVGHVIGVESDLLVRTMSEAEALFDRIQKRARRKRVPHDPRPSLGSALINSIEKSIPFRSLKPLASLITLYLTSRETAKDLGFSRRVSMAARISFSFLAKIIHIADRSVRVIDPAFSVSRFVIRIVGYQLLQKVLTDTEQPIDLPPHLRSQIDQMLHDWSHDPRAPHWMNALEDYFTTHGSWRETIRT
jgi:hypothetical protein